MYCLKRPKINEKEAGVGPLKKKGVATGDCNFSKVASCGKKQERKAEKEWEQKNEVICVKV